MTIVTSDFPLKPKDERELSSDNKPKNIEELEIAVLQRLRKFAISNGIADRGNINDVAQAIFNAMENPVGNHEVFLKALLAGTLFPDTEQIKLGTIIDTYFNYKESTIVELSLGTPVLRCKISGAVVVLLLKSNVSTTFERELYFGILVDLSPEQ